MALFVGVSLAPDLDVVSFVLGIPYSAAWGHRGAVHSPFFALLFGAGTFWLVRRSVARPLWFAALVCFTFMSHGLLDCLTDGGLGVALAWPWSDARFFFPWRPIPVAPIGLGFLSPRGLMVFSLELVMFLPVVVLALWPRRGTAVPK